MKLGKVLILGGALASAIAAAITAVGHDVVANVIAIVEVGIDIALGLWPAAVVLSVLVVGVVCMLTFYRRLLLGSLLFLVSFGAYASDALTVDDGGLIAMIVSALPTLIDIMPAWVGVLIGVLYAVSHLIATLPTKFTESWPSWLKSLVNLLAANYGKAKNKDA